MARSSKVAEANTAEQSAVRLNIDIQIEHRPIERLIPRINNPRTHSRQQVAQIAASILEFGWTNPILVDEGDEILAGHARVLAAKKPGRIPFARRDPDALPAGALEAQPSAPAGHGQKGGQR